jgi:hypothetical protein
MVNGTTCLKQFFQQNYSPSILNGCVLNRAMEKIVCTTCQKPKAPLKCGLCECAICKNCTEFVSEDAFAYLEKIPQELTHQAYCLSCYNEKVDGQLQAYRQTMELAKNIIIYNKKQFKETRFIKRYEEPYKITDCLEESEVIMKMAFRAIRANYNAVIDVEVIPEKVRDGSYQTTKWSGSGIPAEVLDSQLVKDRSFKSTPN